MNIKLLAIALLVSSLILTGCGSTKPQTTESKIMQDAKAYDAREKQPGYLSVGSGGISIKGAYISADYGTPTIYKFRDEEEKATIYINGNTSQPNMVVIKDGETTVR